MDLVLAEGVKLDALSKDVPKAQKDCVSALDLVAALDVDGRTDVVGVCHVEFDGSSALGTLTGAVESAEHELVGGVEVRDGAGNDDRVGCTRVKTQ